MYPGPDLLQEVGRITIAGARLDVSMGFLWHHLDRSKSLDDARRALGREQRRAVRQLAEQRLVGALRKDVLRAVGSADRAHRKRNEVVHQDWLLRGRDALRPVAEISAVSPDELGTYLEDWQRESKPSPDWLRIPRDTTSLQPAQQLAELRRVERALSAAYETIWALTFPVASSRDTGHPRGYVHPA